ncbi:hypothetical protein [Marinomonas sp. THO17]|uniref:hypothetical protein n=1 Tax=Marinomonas sp. THO17 TaxID=3149048 RepID=UPI00336BD976
MFYVNKSAHLSTRLFSIFLLIGLTACQAESDTALVEKTFQNPQLQAVIHIPEPKMGSLFNLRGMAGKGELIARSISQTCVAMPVRFAAGDFGGNTVSVAQGQNLELHIYDRELVAKLLAGNKITSEDYHLTAASDPHSIQTGMQIEAGISRDFGFVINPRKWSWTGLFGINKRSVSCEQLSF